MNFERGALTFRSIPVDVLAMMLQQESNRSIRALCRADLRIPRLALVGKIAALRQERLAWRTFARMHSKLASAHSMEALMVMELMWNLDNAENFGFDLWVGEDARFASVCCTLIALHASYKFHFTVAVPNAVKSPANGGLYILTVNVYGLDERAKLEKLLAHYMTDYDAYTK
jgi:hypothetical protein